MDSEKNVRISPITGKPVRKYNKIKLNRTPAPYSNVVKSENFERLPENLLLQGYGQFKIPLERQGSDIKYCPVFYASISPTLNCQMSSIAWFNNLINNSTNPRQQLYEVHRKTSKRLAIVDFNQSLLPKVNEIFKKDEIVQMNNYKSSNGSDMCLGIINISKLKDE